MLVDLGTGRGELLTAALQRGAARAVGVEYSPDAVALARASVHPRAEVLLADARAVPVDDGAADLVTLLDVVEHLSPEELARALGEARRLLRPGGRLFVHTFPTSTYYAVTYRLLRAAFGRGSWPADPRNRLEHAMHVNEQSARRLRRALRAAGFARPKVWHGRWIHDGVLPDPRACRIVHALAARRLTRPLGAADLWALAHR